MTLFRLDASIRVDGSHSRALGDLVEHEWRERRDARRTVGQSELHAGAADDSAISVFSGLIGTGEPDPMPEFDREHKKPASKKSKKKPAKAVSTKPAGKTAEKRKRA